MGGRGGSSGSGGRTGSGGTAGGGGASGSALDECFAGLRALSVPYQIATKVSADGKTRVRIALEYPPDVVGTSGTYPWRVVRFGIDRDGGPSACVTDPARMMYNSRHHNCGDTATVTADGTTYLLTAPDRSSTGIEATGASAFGATTVSNTTCLSTTACRSGGPC